MEEQLPELPEKVVFRCVTCGRLQAASRDELHRDVEDKSRWPHCCGAKMAVVLPK
jgi:hypothetical protein